MDFSERNVGFNSGYECFEQTEGLRRTRHRAPLEFQREGGSGNRVPHQLPALVHPQLQVIDRILRHELPQGFGWRRYNHDAYGEKEDGSAFDGTGVGRCWPILTGERGHYELAAGRDPKPFITMLEKFANQGGMLGEQLWDAADLAGGRLKRGLPTGAAMPLCWSHAEYISLVRSRHDGVCFDRIEPAFQRYVKNTVQSRFEIWTLRYQARRMKAGKTLRMILPLSAKVVWTIDSWAHTNTSDSMVQKDLGVWFLDFPTSKLPIGNELIFTLFWNGEEHWAGQNWNIRIE